MFLPQYINSQVTSVPLRIDKEIYKYVYHTTCIQHEMMKVMGLKTFDEINAWNIRDADFFSNYDEHMLACNGSYFTNMLACCMQYAFYR